MPSMKLSPKKQKKPAQIETIREEYPYGLRLSLDADSLKKLGMTVDDFNLDDKIVVTGLAKVESLNKRSALQGTDYEDVSLQITDLYLVKKGSKKTLKQVKKVINKR
jgi:hypothetical protein